MFNSSRRSPSFSLHHHLHFSWKFFDSATNGFVMPQTTHETSHPPKREEEEEEEGKF
jgi:hypothetical protein